MATPTTSKGNEWRGLIPISINHQRENPVTALKFDPYTELLWCGSATGGVCSFSAVRCMDRYSAFISTLTGSVNDIEITEDIVFSLTSTHLRGHNRQGIPITKYSSSSMTNMQAMYRMTNSSVLVMGGDQQKLLQYDYEKEKEIRTTDINENGVTMIKGNGSSLFTADNDGYINVRNSKSFNIIQRIQCHGDRISDFDVQGSKLITCGFSQKQKNALNDPFVKVYDLRNYKALPPISLTFLPYFCRFMPSYCERIIVASQRGNVRISDLNSNGVGTSILVDSTHHLSCFDYSTSKEYLAFGNHGGNIHVFVDGFEPIINEHSLETVFAFPPIGPPVSFSIEDSTTPLSTVPMPFPEDEVLLSDWPSELTEPAYRLSRPREEPKDVKVLHNITQCKNPRGNTNLRYHNIAPYILEEEKEPEKEPENPIEVKLESEKVKIPRMFKKCPTVFPASLSRGSRINEQSQNYYFNPTSHVPLESTYYMNIIVNPIVQALYHIISIRNILYSHVCIEEYCLACELRFLFAMISDRAKTSPVVSTSLIRCLVANGFTILKKDVKKSMENALKMILNVISECANDIDVETTLLTEKERECLKTLFNVNLRCVRCGNCETHPSETNFITLNYNSSLSSSFCSIVEKALHLRSNSTEERECKECGTTTRMLGKQRVKSLPPILVIDTNTESDKFQEFWNRQLSLCEIRPNRRGENELHSPAELKPCRFGEDCRNKKKCQFTHGKIDWNQECEMMMEDAQMDGWQHYVKQSFSATVNDGIVRLNDFMTSSVDETSAVYELMAVVALVGSGENSVKWTHAVSMLKDDNDDINWSLINEQLICRIHENEAIHFDSRWKIPMLLVYVNKNELNIKEEKRAPIPETVFFLDDNLASNPMTSSGQVEKIDLPNKGELVGIDAEFIKVKCKFDSDMRRVVTRAVGRVSCVDSTGEKIVFDDHVRVTSPEDVADYLTQFSGIVSEDLDAAKSSKYLTTLKRVYLKILVLVQRGCIFVGHALNNDFSVLNIHVPEEQIIDTVNLLRLDSKRLLSLQFLALELLGDKIQEDSHDSVVDAKYALKIYRRYCQLKEEGLLKSEIRRIYDIVPCGSPMKSVSPASSTN